MRGNAKARTGGPAITAQDVSIETEMDEAAYNLALVEAFVVGWNFTRYGVPVPLAPDEAKRESIAGLPDPLYKPLLKEVLKLAAGRTEQEQAGFRDSSPGLGE
jgi:hypothetical protein